MAGKTLLEMLAKGARIGSKIDKELGEATKDLGSDAMDMGLLGRLPMVEQASLERYVAPRGMPKSIPNLINKESVERLAETARRGSEMGGMEWYNLEPLRMAYVDKLGEIEGNARFKRFTEFVAATSPRSTVSSNIRRASLFDSLDRQGVDFSQMTNADMPTGYGHIAHNTQMSLLGDLANGGSFSSVNRPKTSGFGENLYGNWKPLTSDTHNMSAVRGDPSIKKSPTKAEYKYIEDAQTEIADRLGITPAQIQANIWLAGDTGVADSRPFIAVFDDVLKRTAKKNNTTSSQALHDFIVNGKPLFGMGALTTAIAQLKDDEEMY